MLEQAVALKDPGSEPSPYWSIPHRFIVLDTWRGLAALWVAAYHFRVMGHISETHFVRSGLIAVDFFFVLSGFVIWHGFGWNASASAAPVMCPRSAPIAVSIGGGSSDLPRISAAANRAASSPIAALST